MGLDKTVLFWILVGVLGFAFALAVQMRVITALVLRRALKAWRADLEDPVKANAAVITAASAQPVPAEAQPWLSDAVEHLRTIYPAPLGHLRKARRFSVITPVLLLSVLALGRLIWGVV